MKIVINAQYGGFGLSEEAEAKYKGILGIVDDTFYSRCDIPRDCAVLIALVEKLGDRINTPYSSLKIVEVPDDADWYIDEQDGREWIAEVHRTWR